MFDGFSFDYDTPDSTTICRFRNHLMERGLDVKLFNMLAEQLEKHELIIKQGAIVDASIVTSSRRPRKIQTIKGIKNQEGEEPVFEVNTTNSDDPDAAWTIKANKPYYGYKMRIPANLDSRSG